MSPRQLLHLAGWLFGLCCTSHVQATPTRLQDVNGRDIVVDVPAKRVVLGFYFEDYMAVGGENAFDKVVGISRAAWEGWRPANWVRHAAHRPTLKTLPDVGEVEAQTFSVEKVLALKPDVLVLSDWQYQALGSEVKRLEAADIPVAVADFHAQTVARHTASIKLFGQLTGQQTRAQRIAREYQSAVALVQNRIARAGLPKPRVYVEFGNKGPAEYSFTYGKSMWGAMVGMAGGDNIAAPLVEHWGPINPEQVLAARPDVIMISGTESTKNPASMLIGFGIDKATASQRLATFTKRSGWSDLPAVKTKRVFGVYHGAARTISDFALLQYMAKAFYPSLFQDQDPEANYLAFYRRYLPIWPQGSFMVQVTGQWTGSRQ